MAAAIQFRIVASDMDGTLLNKQHQLSARTKHVLFRLARERDVSFVFATGRHHLSVRDASDGLLAYFDERQAEEGGTGRGVTAQGFYLVSSNGARVHSPSGELVIRHDLDVDVVKVIYEQYALPYTRKRYAGPSPSQPSSPVSPASVDAAVPAETYDESQDEILDEEVVSTSAYTTTEWFMTSSFMTPEQMERKFGVRPNVIPFDRHDERNAGKSVLDSFPIEGVGKLCFRCADRSLLEGWEREMLEQFGDRISVAFSSDFSLDVMRGGTSKASALREVSELLGASMQEVVAFGDSMNDAEMLRDAGKGFVMQNAQERLKRLLPQCDVVGHHEANGVAEKLAEMYTLSADE